MSIPFILDQIQQGALLINRQGQVAVANIRLGTLLGLAPQDLIGLPLATQLRLAARLGFQSERLDFILHQLRAGDWSAQVPDQDYELTDSYHRLIRRQAHWLKDESGQMSGLLFLFTDITQQQELRQMQAEMTSLIVHDLRSPLSALTASMRLLQETAAEIGPEGDMIQKTSQVADRAVKKLLNLVNSLLDIAKGESGALSLEREAVDLNELAESVLSELGPLAEEMEVSLTNQTRDRLLMVDADKIERVLYNLVDNAIKFTPGGGHVSLSNQAWPANTALIRINVIDTGPGIPPAYRERIFDRFQQISTGERGARRRGTGLGLSFCKLAIEAHGGQIWIEDHPGGGTVFAFTLPLSES
jgi:signal transduction histidine kinase